MAHLARRACLVETREMAAFVPKRRAAAAAAARGSPTVVAHSTERTRSPSVAVAVAVVVVLCLLSSLFYLTLFLTILPTHTHILAHRT